LFPVSYLHWSKHQLQNVFLLSCMRSHLQTGAVMAFCLSVLYATYRIIIIALVTCLPTYRTMAQYFTFLSEFSFDSPTYYISQVIVWKPI
jgi:hypothetical protein